MNAGEMPYFGEDRQANRQAGAGQQAPMSEQDMTQDMLGCQKALANGYGTMILEASCPQLREILAQNWRQTVEDQYAIFEQMRTRGWYQTPPAQQQEIMASQQQFAQMQMQLQ